LAERGRELYWEFGIRRQELIRNGIFISNAVARGISVAKPHQVLFPIPAVDISLKQPPQDRTILPPHFRLPFLV
jgi:hypothetical protein